MPSPDYFDQCSVCVAERAADLELQDPATELHYEVPCRVRMEVDRGTITNGEATSPTSVRSEAFKRKRSDVGASANSPTSGTYIGDNEEEVERRRQPGVKRACNECRQQKLRCDVVQTPFSICSRCNRMKLECKIESNFKRVGKRSKQSELEKEIGRLRRNLSLAKSQGYIVEDEDSETSPIAHDVFTNSQPMGSVEAVSSLLQLKQSRSYHVRQKSHAIENVTLTEDVKNQLFREFWCHYHPFLPFLSPAQTPEQYYQQHPLLFWMIVAIASRRYTTDPMLLNSLSGPVTRLLWATVSEVPSNHYVVKALCLACTWPFPTSTTSTDPTHILCGVMMKAATGIGLHRPNHVLDFSRVSIELNKEQLHDRVTTWAVCNIVAQHCGTGYGQPASSLHNWTLTIRVNEEGPILLHPEIEAHLQIERFCDKVSTEMYSNASDPPGVVGDEIRAVIARVYRREFNELQASILCCAGLSRLINIHLAAANLHLCLYVFFDSSTKKGYSEDLMGLWCACVTYLDLIFELDTSSPEIGSLSFLRHATNYLFQMTTAACFTLLKLLGSFFVREIDFGHGSSLFHRTIQALRTISVTRNDLPWRLSELMIQMWNGARVEQRETMANMQAKGSKAEEIRPVIDDILKLKVRCRMSMSLVFDSIWRWREEFQSQGRSSLEASKNLAFSNHQAISLSNVPRDHLCVPVTTSLLSIPQSQNLSAENSNLPDHNLNGDYILGGLGNSINYDVTENNFERFDPFNWMFDGLMDFSYNGFSGAGGSGDGL